MKVKFFFRAFITLILSALTGCIEPLEVDIKSDDVRLVVNGIITDDPVPYTVTLTQTKAIPYVPYKIPVVTGAIVIIADAHGNTEQLFEREPGVYLTGAAFRGQVGQTYTLFINTPDGKKYTSTAEKIVAVPEIDSLYFEVERRIALNEENVPREVYWLNAFVNTRDLTGQQDYYKWEYEAVYQIDTQPWLHKRQDARGNWVPDPLSCCKTCWITQFNNVISLQHDQLLNGKEISRQLVVTLPINNQLFNSRLRLEVTQYSISEGAYDYWNLLKTQIGGVGNIQDPPPAFVRGNISSLSGQDEVPLGFFGASAVARKSIFVSTSQLGIGLPAFEYANSCLVLENSTTLMPASW